MAADLKAPRITRTTTNMQDAAAAMRARSMVELPLVDGSEIDNALCDLEVALVFIDSTDNYADELNEWFRPGGCAPNAALHGEVAKMQTLLHEAVCRITNAAEKRLRPASRQAYALQNQRRATREQADREYRFNEAFIPYRDAWNLGVATYMLHFPGLTEQDRCSAEYCAFEKLMDPLYLGARDAAMDALLAPAATVADLLVKQEIIDQQEIQHASDGDMLGKIMAQLIADGVALAGAGA